MKARVNRIDIPEQVLLYRLEETSAQGRAVQAALRELGIPFRLVSGENLGQTVGFLTGLPGFPQNSMEEAPPFEEPAMVMQGLGSVRMDRLLLALRKADASVALKAAVTPTNQNWTLGRLLLEIAKEHAYMTQKHKTMHQGK